MLRGDIPASRAKALHDKVDVVARALDDAARWRALMGCARMHFMGCAGFELRLRPGAPPDSRKTDDMDAVPRPAEAMHFGMEFWSNHSGAGDPRYPDRFERDMMITFADELIARAAAATKENADAG